MKAWIIISAIVVSLLSVGAVWAAATIGLPWWLFAGLLILLYRAALDARRGTLRTKEAAAHVAVLIVTWVVMIGITAAFGHLITQAPLLIGATLVTLVVLARVLLRKGGGRHQSAI